MATYQVQGPDGKNISVEGPENATDDELIQVAARDYYSNPANIEKKYTTGQTLGKAFDRGKRRLGSTFGDLIPAIGGSVLGFDEYAEKQLDEAEQSEAYIQRNLAPKYPSFKDVDGVGSALEFAGETVFEQFPNLASMLITGGIGFGAARVGAAKLGAKALAKRQARGQAGGVYLGSYALNSPEIFQNIYEETGKLAPGAALLFGAAAAGLDSVLPQSILKGISPAAKAAITKEALKKSGMRPGLAESVFKNVLKGTAQEGLTEGAQEAISITAENFVGDNPQIFESEDWERIVESSVRGAVAGGVFKGASAPIERLNTPAAPPAAPPASPTVDPVLLKRKQASATALGLTLVPSPNITGDFEEAIKIREVEQPTALGDGLETVSIREIYAFDEDANKWVKVREEVVEDSIKDAMDDDEEKENIEQESPVQESLPGVPLPQDMGPIAPPLEAPIEDTTPTVKNPTGKPPPKQPFFPELMGQLPIPTAPVDTPTTIREEPGRSAPKPKTRDTEADRLGLSYDDVTDTAYDAENNITYTWDDSKSTWIKLNAKLNEKRFRTTGASDEISRQPGPNESASTTASPNVTRVGTADGPISTDRRRKKIVSTSLDKNNVPKKVIGSTKRLNRKNPVTTQTSTAFFGQESTGPRPTIAELNKNEAPKYNTAQEMKEDLYKEFGKKPIDRLLDRGHLNLIDSAADLPDGGLSIGSGTMGFYQWNPSSDKFRTGVTTVIADRNFKGTARDLLLHEIGEHYGLEGMLGKNYMPTLIQLERLKDTDPVVAQAWATVTKNYSGKLNNPKDKRLRIGGPTFLTEVAAHVGESAPENTFFRRIIGMVKNFLRNLGLYDPNKLTARDLQDMILYSLNRTLYQRVPRARLNPNEEVETRYKKSIDSEIYSKENPPGAFRPATARKILDKAGEGYKSIQKGTPKILDDIRNKMTQLPRTLLEAKMGMLGLVAISQLYKKYVPSFGTMMDLLERRAGRADRARAEVDRLGYIGMDAVKGKKRNAIKIVDREGNDISFENFFDGTKRVKEDFTIQKIPTEVITTEYTKKQLDDWANIVLDLSRGEEGVNDKGIDPTDPENRFHPLVGKFKKLPEELQIIALAYSSQYTQYAKKFNAAVLKLLPDRDRKGNLIPPSKKAERFKTQLISNELNFYHPFRRRGAHVLKYIPGGTTEGGFAFPPYTERFESPRELEAAIEQVKATGGTFLSSYVSPETGGNRQDQVPDQFFQDVLEVITTSTSEQGQQSQVGQEMIEQIYEFYIEMFPNSSVRQMTRAREGVRGEIQDLVGGFIDVGARMANQVTNMEYIPQFNETAKAINEEARTAQIEIERDDAIEPGDKNKLQYQIAEAAIDVTDRSRSFFNNPVPDRLSGNLAYVSFLSTIAGNVSSALVNLTQILIIVIPHLVAKHGPVKATRLLTDATSVYLNGGQDNNRGWQGIKGFGGPDISFAMKNGFRRTQENAAKGLIDQADVLPEELIALYEEGLETSVFRRGLGYELTEMRKKNSADFTGVKAKVDSTLGWIFQNTERFNREVTYLASYMGDRDMIKNDKGQFVAGPNAKSIEDSIKQAKDFTRESHGTSLPELGPRYFQTGWGKTIFTFKRYAHAMMSVLIRLAYDSFKGGDVRRAELAKLITETRMELGYSTASNNAVAAYQKEIDALKLIKRTARIQLTGIYGMSFTVAGVQGMPLYGMTETFSEAMNAMFGDDDEPYDFNENVRDLFGEFGYKGPLNKLLDTDIAARTGFSNLIWRDDPRRVAEIGVPGYILETLLGPSYSYARNIGRGMEDWGEGNIYRGVEQMMPAFARNGMKSFRYATEGARTRNGAKLVDDLNAYNNFMQVFGFTNEDLSNAYERNNAMKQAERKILKKRSGLLTAAFLARDTGDRELLKEVQKQISIYNRSDIGKLNRITSKTLNTSYKQKKRSIEESVNGITLTKKYKDYLQENYGS